MEGYESLYTKIEGENSPKSPDVGVEKSTDFFSQFWEDKKELIIKSLKDDSQLKEWFDEILKSDDLKEKLQAEISDVFKQNLDEEDLEILIQSIISENIPWWYIIGYEDISNMDSYVTEQTDEIREQTDEAKEETIETDIKKIQRENMLKALDARNKLLEANPEIDENEIQKKARSVQIPEWTKKQFEERYGTDFVDNYILLRVTVDEIKNNPDWNVNPIDFSKFEESVDKLSSFDIFLKNLDNACNIPDTSVSSFSDSNISNIRAELFHDKIWNQWLIEQRQRNIESHNYRYEWLFPNENDEEKTFAKYWKFLDWDLKDFWEQYQSDSNMQQEIRTIDIKSKWWHMLTQEEIMLINNYYRMKNEIDKIKGTMETDTKNMIEELCMTSQIKWFLTCIPKEYAGKFQFNKSREITFGNNWVLQLNWHINWVNFSLKHDTKDKDAHLQTLTTLFKDGNKFNLWNNYINSPFILPSWEKVFNVALNTLWSDDLSKIENKDDYFSTLERLVLKNMDELYADTKFTHHFIKKQIKNEEIIHETESIIGNFWWLKDNLSVTDWSLYDFFDTLHFNLEKMSDDEKEKFLTYMKELWDLISKYIDTTISWDNDKLVENEELSNKLWSKDVTCNILSWKIVDEWKKSFFNFFEELFYEKNSNDKRKKIDLERFSKCLEDVKIDDELQKSLEGFK